MRVFEDSRPAIAVNGDQPFAPCVSAALVVDHAVGGISPIEEGPAVEEVATCRSHDRSLAKASFNQFNKKSTDQSNPA